VRLLINSPSSTCRGCSVNHTLGRHQLQSELDCVSNFKPSGVVIINVEPVSENAQKVFKEIMESNSTASLEMARDGAVFFVSQNRLYETWSALDGPDWKVNLPSRSGKNN